MRVTNALDVTYLAMCGEISEERSLTSTTNKKKALIVPLFIYGVP